MNSPRAYRGLRRTLSARTQAQSGGTINVSSILSGKCVAKLAAGDALPQLHDVTSIFYNEERDELYVGTKSGMLYLWSL